MNYYFASWFGLVCGMLSTAHCLAEQTPNTLTEPERRAGWRLLFDGTSTDAFRGYGSDSLGAGWGVEDGALVCRGDAAGVWDGEGRVSG